MYIVSRGMFCGCGRGKPTCLCRGKRVQCTFWFEAGRFMRKYHAYFIAFALINDFWYHPFESSPGHLMGILNDILLLWQSTTIYTHGHRNKWWCLLLEIMVLPHSAMIALDRGTGASGMFGFAYFLLLVVTKQFQVQMHAAFRIILILGFLGSLFAVYGLSLQYYCTSCESLGFGRIWMTVLIPAMNYAVGAIYFPIMYWLFRLCLGKMKPSKCRTALIWLACIIVIGAIWPIFTTFARPSDDNAKIRENMIK